MSNIVGIDRPSIRSWLHFQVPRLEAAARMGRLPSMALDLGDEFERRLGNVSDGDKIAAMRVLNEEIQALTAEMALKAGRNRVGCGSLIMMAISAVVTFVAAMMIVAQGLNQYPYLFVIPFVAAAAAPFGWLWLTRR